MHEALVWLVERESPDVAGRRTRHRNHHVRQMERS